MSKRAKIILIIVIVVIVATISTILIIRRRRRRLEEEAEQQGRESDLQKKLDEANALQQQTVTAIGNQTTGRFAYSKVANTTIRNSPEVNDGYLHNRIGKIKAGFKMGQIIEDKIGADQMKWYKIKFAKPIPYLCGNCFSIIPTSLTNAVDGWVRSDVVEIKNI